MAVNSSYRSLGSNTLPLGAGDLRGGNVLKTYVRDNFLEMFEAAINEEFSEVWPSMIVGTDLATAATPVIGTFPFEPESKALNQWQAGFPLLCWHPTGEMETTDYAHGVMKAGQTWHLHYILKAMTQDHLTRFMAMQWKLAPIMMGIQQSNGHPAYAGGVNQMGPGAANLHTFAFNGIQGGSARFEQDDSAHYHAFLMRFRIEMTSDVRSTSPLYAPYDSTQYTIGLGSPEGILPEVIIADTHYVPPNT